MRTDQGQRKLSAEPSLRNALRRTRDVDFATRTESASLLPVLNELAASSAREVHVLGPRAMRMGPVAVSFTLGPEDLSGMASHYDAFLDSRVPVRLRRGQSADELPVIGLEQLVATKLTRRGDKAKDLLDVTELVAAAKDAQRMIDLRLVHTFVDDNPEALELMEQIRVQLMEEEE